MKCTIDTELRKLTIQKNIPNTPVTGCSKKTDWCFRRSVSADFCL